VDTTILHETGTVGADPIPASVRALDAICNARIGEARTAATLNTELRRKQYLKRILVELPPADLEIYALAHLAVLEQGMSA